MGPFSAAFLSGLAANLTTGVVNSLTGMLKRQVSGTPAQAALERSLYAGVVALAAQSTADEPAQGDRDVGH